jgi:SAM-dependent methyltransferase
MALVQHRDLKIRFQQQYDNSRDYVIPFIEETFSIKEGMNVLEIGAAEGGVIKPLAERGCYVVGVDLNPGRIETAKAFLADEVAAGKAYFVAQNVYDDSFQEKWTGFFDLIILKDTIEHIPNQEEFIPFIKRYLKPDGAIFFGFPPWRMPFGGHQQICVGKFLSKLPWYHVLPKGIYKAMLKAGGESDAVIKELLYIKETRISIARFERIVRTSELPIALKRLFLVNPIYKHKFGWKPRVQNSFFGAIPWLKDWYTTCAWYVVRNKN